MGVSGLLPLLKSIHKHTSLKAYAGQTLGVDAFGWLHRGAVACALQLALDKPTTQYVSFVVNRVRMLLDFGITPYLVFDGDSLPSKGGTNAKRRKERQAAKELGMSLYHSGKHDQACQELQKAVTVTPQMTFALIEELRRMNVQILVAPYEADAQLTYLEREGIIDGILSEDSDLLVFGARKLITKLDQYGACIEINRSDFILNRDISFAGWSDTMFRRMAILSGCDYLPSVSGIGLRKGHELVKKHKDLARIVRAMALNGKYVVPQDYLSSFQDAERAFLYHRVFCPKFGRVVTLNHLPPDLKEEEMPYIGTSVEPEIAVGVACGDLNPKTKEPFVSGVKDLKNFTSRAVLQESRRRTYEGSPGLKPKRSIDSFFPPSRRPLAELDPNSLTPSPSQQRVLERNRNATWEPRYASSAPPLRRTITDLPPSSSTPVPARVNKSSFLAKAGAPSTYKPAKRQRLCSESDDVSPCKEIKQSRYFASSTNEHSPLISKKTRDKRAQKPMFDVFSDDSVENIFAAMEQQVLQPPKVTVDYPELPKLPVDEGVALIGREEEEEEEIIPQSSPAKPQDSQFDSQSSHGTVELQAMELQSQSDSQTSEEIMISKDEQPKAFEKLLEQNLKQLRTASSSRRMSRTFSGQSPLMQSSVLATLSPSLVPPPTRTHLELEGELETEDLQHGSVTTFKSLARTFVCQSPERQHKALQTLCALPPISNMAYSLSTTAVEGSEDAIPFSSQDEISEVEERPVSSLNLKKFQFLAS
ncbi:Rad2 nuclease [Lithohypha guttulata]|uniref:Rad2 nuclease n=1 Tax=Lithohypha guttulata TaxID=1690604 RepID=UPI00315CA91E